MFNKYVVNNFTQIETFKCVYSKNVKKNVNIVIILTKCNNYTFVFNKCIKENNSLIMVNFLKYV